MFGLQGGISTQAQNAATTAGNVGAGYGTGAATASSQLMPFLTRELNNPQGYTQQQTGSMLDAAEGGAGGSTAGLTTEANLASARDRNSGGFSGALDNAARTQDKTLAGTSEGIAANNANLQQQQQQSAASGLANQQGMDQSAQLKAMGLEAPDLNAANSSYNTGDWAQGLNTVMGVGNNIGKTECRQNRSFLVRSIRTRR
jgi:hypothetical protein